MSDSAQKPTPSHRSPDDESGQDDTCSTPVVPEEAEDDVPALCTAVNNMPGHSVTSAEIFPHLPHNQAMLAHSDSPIPRMDDSHAFQ